MPLNKTNNFLRQKSHYIALILAILSSIVVTYKIYSYTSDLLRESLNTRLLSIVNTGAQLFKESDIKQLMTDELKSVNSPIYKKVVFKLQQLRFDNPGIRYAYILKKTSDNKIVKFVADADAISITPAIDFNQDGVVDDEDVSIPGEEYDATDVPALNSGDAFIKPSVDEDLSVDEWGTFLSAYAPIGKNNSLEASLVVDVDVSDFVSITRATLLPFILFVALILLILTFLTIYIEGLWKNNIRLLIELDRQKDELLSIVAHQLLTPTTAMRWSAEALLDEKERLSKDQIEMSTTIQHQATELADLIGVILDVSRIQLDRVPVKRAQVDLDRFFGDILSVIKIKALEKKVNLNVHLPTALPQGSLDERYTRMAVENLLSNAVKYTPQGGDVVLDVQCDNDWMDITVKDTGVGIPKADQEKIFGKMFRASNVTGTIEGNGFGLYIAKGSIEAQGGSIGFASQENKGTTFWIRMPLTEEALAKAVRLRRKKSFWPRLFGRS